MGHSKDEADWIVLDRLADIILKGVEGCVVDIGIGLSTVILARHAARFKRKHFSCDISEKIVNYFIPDGKLHELHTVSTCDAAKFVKDFHEIPALVFIDGHHYYEQVIIQIDHFLQSMPFGGVLFLHDTTPPPTWTSVRGRWCGNIYRARQELENRKDVCTFTWPYEYQAQKCGLTMVMKWAGV